MKRTRPPSKPVKDASGGSAPQHAINKRDTVRASIATPRPQGGRAQRVIILGRPNVGKSTLFNRLVGQKLAMVDDQPGVTRDWRQAAARVDDLQFDLIDTAGFEQATAATAHDLTARITHRTLEALRQADLILFVFDARAGVTPIDRDLAQLARASSLPVICLANKAETRAAAQIALEGYELGLGAAIPFSAEHGIGISELYDSLRPHIQSEPIHDQFADGFGDENINESNLTEIDWKNIENIAAQSDESADESYDESSDESAAEPDPKSEEILPTSSRPLSLAVMGRPNVGKSTLVNAMLGEERMMTGPEAGLTRESIAAELWHQSPSNAALLCLRLIDTAGIRRKKQAGDDLEQLSVADSLRTLRFAEMVILVVDGQTGLEKQDLTLASMIAAEGRGLVIAVNKWDAVQDKNEILADMREVMENSLPQLRGVPLVTISALKGIRLTHLLDQVVAQYGLWQSRISTGAVNRWLARAVAAHPPPLFMGHTVRLRYATQIKTRPPSLVIFASRPDQLPESYLRYLIGSFRDYFNLPGIPIRISLRKGKNPYAERGN
ncbi:MAG: ribosome biogenesis GTPase Der [Candidatus Symbiobacter sp.]|nr:ribosome biogenesis GTPase Der [Candidatus Symbiobacter sp.]